MRKNLKNWCSSLIIFLLCASLAGCGPAWKNKFVRKRAPKVEPQVYEPKEYQREASDELYKRRFIFWKSWHQELVNKLGDNKYSDLRSFEEALKNLNDMKTCLNDEKALQLDAEIKKLDTYYRAYKERDLDIIRSRQMRQDLDRLMLSIDKAFRYTRVKEFIR